LKTPPSRFPLRWLAILSITFTIAVWIATLIFWVRAHWATNVTGDYVEWTAPAGTIWHLRANAGSVVLFRFGNVPTSAFTAVHVELPYWVLLVGSVLPSAALGAKWLRHHNRVRQMRLGLCHQCGYDLHGNVSGRCPECGATTSKALAR
jgi:hypothetical protein